VLRAKKKKRKKRKCNYTAVSGVIHSNGHTIQQEKYILAYFFFQQTKKKKHFPEIDKEETSG
jgi:hypothetical protein